MATDPSRPLTGSVALVAGATRGAGRAIAVELARAGAFVYATGRSSAVTGPSEIGRRETIEETGELMTAAGGSGSARVVDHEDSAAVRQLVDAIDSEHGRLDLLVNDIFGGDRYAQFDKPLWEHDLDGGLRMLRMGVDTHLLTAATALPLLIRTGDALLVEMTDGTAEFNAAYREGVGFFYDLVKASVGRIVVGLTAELQDQPVTALAVTPGWLRSENMLDNFGVTEQTWRDAVEKVPGFAHLRDADVRRARRRGAGGRPRQSAVRRADADRAPAVRHLRRHRRRRLPTGRLGADRGARHGRRRPRTGRAIPLTRAGTQ